MTMLLIVIAAACFGTLLSLAAFAAIVPIDISPRSRQIFTTVGLVLATHFPETSHAQRIDAEERYGDWHLMLLRDPISDEKWPMAIIHDKQQPSVFLRFECRANRLMIVAQLKLPHGFEEGRSNTLQIRFDREPIRQETWVGFAYKSIFPEYGKEAELLKRVINSSEMIIRAPISKDEMTTQTGQYGDGNQDAVFTTIDGFEALSPIAKACGIALR